MGNLIGHDKPDSSGLFVLEQGKCMVVNPYEKMRQNQKKNSELDHNGII
jgi:hypothetical protein